MELWAFSLEGVEFRSRDGGKTWDPLPIGSGSLNLLRVGEKDGFAEIWALGASLWRKGRAGTWARIPTPPAHGRILGIALSRQAIFLLTHQGFLHSIDEGRSWHLHPIELAEEDEDDRQGLLTGVSRNHRDQIEVRPAGTEIWLTWRYPMRAAHVSLSDPAKDIWQLEQLETDKTDNPRYLGFYGGAQWAVVGDDEGSLYELSSRQKVLRRPGVFGSQPRNAARSPDGRLWVAGDDCLLTSSVDEGSSWTRQKTGCQETKMWRFIYRDDGDTLWVAGPDERLGSQRGEVWREQVIAPGIYLTSIGGRGTDLWVTGAQGTIVHSPDGGQNWSPPRTLAPGRDLLSIQASSSGLWILDEAGQVYELSAGGVWRSLPATQEIEAADFFVSEENEKTIFLAVDTQGMIWRRTSDEKSWSLSKRGLSAIDGSGPTGQLWAAGSDESVFQSPDAGRNWNLVREGSSSPRALQQELKNIVFSEPKGSGVWIFGLDDLVIQGSPTNESYPRAFSARLQKSGLEIRIQPGEGEPELPERILLRAGRRQEFKFDQLREVSRTELTPPGPGSDIWTVTFDPKEVGVDPGDDLYAEVTLETARFRQAFMLPPLPYQPWRPHPLLAGYAAWLALLALLLMVWPVSLFKLQRSLRVLDVSRLLEPVPAIGPTAALALGAAGALPLFVRSRRALDTWVRTHRDTVKERFEAEETVLRSGGYVPLPARVGNPEHGSLLDRPDAPAISRLFSRRRTLIQVVGVGGAGKTMLAVQIARWALAGKDEGGLERKPMLPVLVDEDTADLRAVVKRKLTSWLQEEIGDELLDALLRKQRLLVIVDRVSERQKTTQEHLRTLHGGQPINALVITTRQLIDFEAGGDVRVYPQPLGSETLLHFMTVLLQDPARTGAFGSMGDQLELGKKLADLIRLGTEEVPLTPLLVRLYVDKAVELARRPGASLDELPGSIPDVYFDYLRSVNPDADGSADRMSNEEMLRAAEVLAEVALGESFVPREVPKAKAREALAAAGWKESEGPDPIRRLRDNGVLLETEVGTEVLLRFVLDPVAEFLAAMAHARRCAGSEVAWKRLFKQVDKAGQRAAGFRQALRLVCHAYGERLGWAMPVEKP